MWTLPSEYFSLAAPSAIVLYYTQSKSLVPNFFDRNQEFKTMNTQTRLVAEQIDLSSGLSRLGFVRFVSPIWKQMPNAKSTAWQRRIATTVYVVYLKPVWSLRAIPFLCETYGTGGRHIGKRIFLELQYFMQKKLQ